MSNIQIKNISKSFGELKAVENVCLEIMQGEVFGLLGPNGAGKSTLISMITTLQQPDSGEIVIGGLELFKNQREIKKALGYVPQEIALYPTLTAKENLMFWGRMYGLTGKRLKERVEEVLEITGLQDRAKDKVGTFSGGMKRRINIGAALLHQPKIIIMDEPTVGIDPQSRNHILETVLKLNKEGMTVIYTSHYMEEVEFLCDRIGILDYGQLIAVGKKEELKNLVGNKESIRIKISGQGDHGIEKLRQVQGIEGVNLADNLLSITVKEAAEVLPPILGVLEESGCKIHSIDIKESNLESVFLYLTGRALRD